MKLATEILNEELSRDSQNSDLSRSRILELEQYRKDGTIVWTEVSVRFIRDTEGRPSSILGVTRDITERKQAEQIKRKLEAQLQQAKKLESVGILAGGIAHDFNNLMSAVVGNISLAKTEIKRGSKAFENLVEAEKASIQTKELTARLIIFSEGGGPVKETASIGDLVKSSVGSSLKGSDLNCKFSIPDDISPVEVDEEQMKQVIHNIITNAREAIAGQGTINVSCENVNIGEKDTLTLKNGKYVKISIKDQGPGIPEEDLAKIFDPYFSTKEMGTQKGMGLGLAISDSIVKKHDGLITVESQLGSGTTFSIYLPAASAESQAASAKRLEVDSQSTIINHSRFQRDLRSAPTIQRVLVMDDEEMVRDVSNALLTHIGYEAEVAVDGVEAIEMYRKAMESEKPFDMVILDLTNKFGMGGAETIVRLLEIDPDVKAIVATGYSNDPIISKFREHGFRGALSKPFTLDQLRTALSEVIAGE
jgi:signal transduction histidine kinase/CheY-like chemotaxis protein